MTRPPIIHPGCAAALLLASLLGCGGGTLEAPEDPGPNRPPAASLSASPLEGIAPLEVTLRLSCTDPDRDAVRHLLDVDGKAGFEISEWTTISLKRAFAESTTVSGLCRDEDGAESDPVVETVSVLNILAQRATIMALTNVERQKVGAVALVEDQKLTEFAQAHAEDMAERGYFSHTTPEGKTFSDRLREAGITNVYAGENIALNYSAEGAVTAWVNSSGHYQNMTNSRFRKIGVGVYSTQIKSQGHVYYVQVFTS